MTRLLTSLVATCIALLACSDYEGGGRVHDFSESQAEAGGAGSNGDGEGGNAGRGGSGGNAGSPDGLEACPDSGAGGTVTGAPCTTPNFSCRREDGARCSCNTILWLCDV